MQWSMQSRGQTARDIQDLTGPLSSAYYSISMSDLPLQLQFALQVILVLAVCMQIVSSVKLCACHHQFAVSFASLAYFGSLPADLAEQVIDQITHGMPRA